MDRFVCESELRRHGVYGFDDVRDEEHSGRGHQFYHIFQRLERSIGGASLHPEYHDAQEAGEGDS